MAEAKKEDQTEEFQSRLTHDRTRFLAHVVQHGLESGQRTPDQFVRHFSPATIMEGLRNRPHLRAKILVTTTGTREKIALKKSAESSGEDLQIALDEGETDAETIVSLFHPDDRVRYLDGHALWNYVVEGEFWKASDGIDYEMAKAYIAYILERAIEDRLISQRDVVEGITVEKMAELLPRAELGWILAAALERGRDKKPFTDEDLLAEAPTSVITEHVPLDVVWEYVIIPRIAEAHDFVAATEPPAVPEVPAEQEPAPAEPAPVAEAKEAKETAPKDPKPAASGGSRKFPSLGKKADAAAAKSVGNGGGTANKANGDRAARTANGIGAPASGLSAAKGVFGNEASKLGTLGKASLGKSSPTADTAAKAASPAAPEADLGDDPADEITEARADQITENRQLEPEDTNVNVPTKVK